MNKEKLKLFWNEHKTKMIVAGTLILEGIVAIVAVSRPRDGKKVTELLREPIVDMPMPETIDMPIPDNFEVGNLARLWQYPTTAPGATYAEISHVPIKDLGSVGDALIRHGIASEQSEFDLLTAFRK